MPEKELPRTVSRPVFNTYALTVCALLTALSVVLARVLTLIPAETTRISLEAVPIVLSGLLFGPIPGAVVGFAADLIGCLFSPFGYNPIFCVPPILYGLLAGAVRRYVTDRPALLRTALAFFPAAIVGSVLWQSMALALVYGGDAKQAFFLAKLVSRSIQFALTGTVDTLIVWLLLRRGALNAVQRRIQVKGGAEHDGSRRTHSGDGGAGGSPAGGQRRALFRQPGTVAAGTRRGQGGAGTAGNRQRRTGAEHRGAVPRPGDRHGGSHADRHHRHDKSHPQF